MKTLDEVIIGIKEQMGLGDPILIDALHYLNEYRMEQKILSDRKEHYEYWEHKYYAELEKNDPLTWEQLKQMKGKPVWVEYMDDKQQTGWALIVKNPERPTFGKPKLFAFVREEGKFYLTISGYGRRWQAYRKEKYE